MIPLWLKLIRAHNGEGGYGLAFPFIAGAYQVVGECDEITLDVINSIMASIASETPDESYISVTVCDRLNNPVFAESSSFYKPPCTFTKIPYQGKVDCKLFISSSVLDNSSGSVEKFSEYIWNRYHSELSEGRFSFRNGQFTTFSNSERELISNACSFKENEDA